MRYFTIKVNKLDIEEWCANNLEGLWQVDGDIRSGFREGCIVAIADEADVMLYTLRWKMNSTAFVPFSMERIAPPAFSLEELNGEA